MKSRDDRRDPVKTNPLPEAGQSLREQINALITDEILVYDVWIGSPFAITLLEWYRWCFEVRHLQLAVTAMLAVSIPLAIWRLRRLKEKLQNLQFGFKGEQWLGRSADRFVVGKFAVKIIELRPTALGTDAKGRDVSADVWRNGW